MIVNHTAFLHFQNMNRNYNSYHETHWTMDMVQFSLGPGGRNHEKGARKSAA